MDGLDWNRILRSAPPPLFGKVVSADQPSGRILGYRIDPTNGLDLVFPEDLPGNRWFQVFDARLPLLADQNLNWPHQALALAASSDIAILQHGELGLESVVSPHPPRDWKQSSDVLFRQAFSLKRGSRPIEGQTVTYSLDWTGHPIPTVSPNEIWACMIQDRLYVQVPGPWPYLFAENAARVLDLPEDRITFEVPASQPASSVQSPFLVLASLYASILAIRHRRPIRFLLDADFHRAWPCLPPDLAAEASVEFTENGQIRSFHLHARMNDGFRGPLASETINRFLFTFVQLLPGSDIWVEGWALQTHSAPRFPHLAWGEAAGHFVLQRLLQRIAETLYPTDYDPTIFLTPSFQELAEDIHRTEFWRRWWAVDKTARPGKTSVRFGCGLTYGYHNSGFIEPALTIAQIRLIYSPREKTLDLEAPVPISTEILQTIGKSLPPAEEVRISHVRWYGCTAPNPGPACLGRSYEILPPLVRRAFKSLLMKRNSPRTLTQTVMHRRPKAKVWDPIRLHDMPYLSSQPYALYVRVAFRDGRFHLLRLCLSLGNFLVERKTEVQRLVTKNLWQVLGWLSWDIDHSETDIELIWNDTTQKAERKSVQNLLWTVLPAALAQACALAKPDWKPLGPNESFSTGGA